MEQITIEDYLKSQRKLKMGCRECICKKCLHWWSGRCPHGGCYDDFRAKDEPYNKAHPGLTPRTLWSDWNKPGEQAHWCRGGVFYLAHYCETFEKYEGSTIEECVRSSIEVFQDGYIRCSIKDQMGCEACIDEDSHSNIYNCQYMTDSGCERMITAKGLILDEIAKGQDVELCTEQCCLGCTKICGYRCGQAYAYKLEDGR